MRNKRKRLNVKIVEVFDWKANMESHTRKAAALLLQQNKNNQRKLNREELNEME